MYSIYQIYYFLFLIYMESQQELVIYSLVAALLFYSLIGVDMLRKETLEHFENTTVRAVLLVVIVGSAYIDPMLTLILAISFLMTHQKLQEHKRKETDNVVDKIQKKKKENYKSFAMNEFDNVSGVKENAEEHVAADHEDTNEFTVQPDDAKFNYMSKELVHNAAESFFDIENSFETMGSNLVPGCSLDIVHSKKNNYFEK